MTGVTVKITRRVTKWVVILTATLWLPIGCNRHDPRSSLGRHLEDVRLPIQGMVCGSCVASVKRTLKSIDGVEEVEVSLEKHQARIRYDAGQIRPEQFAHAVQKLGYTPGVPTEIPK